MVICFPSEAPRACDMFYLFFLWIGSHHSLFLVLVCDDLADLGHYLGDSIPSRNCTEVRDRLLQRVNGCGSQST